MEDPVGPAARLRFRRPLRDLQVRFSPAKSHSSSRHRRWLPTLPTLLTGHVISTPRLSRFGMASFFYCLAFTPPEIPGRAMVARHNDAEALARVLRKFGLGLIRGAGAAGRRDRGGAEAAHGAVASLREGFSVAMTADVPPGPARKCGLGIVTIGSLSGQPIVPFAVATSRYCAINSWSRMTINLSFSKLGIVMGDPILVPQAASREELENYRRRVEAALNETTAKAYAVAGADPARATPPPPAVCQP